MMASISGQVSTVPLLAVLGVALALSTPTIAVARGQAGLAPANPAVSGRSPGLNRDQVFTRTVAVEINGGVVVAGCGLRETGPPNGSGTIEITGVPADATVLQAILHWVILSDANLPSDEATFSESSATPQTVIGTHRGSDEDPCWAGSGIETIHGFSADVTSLVAVGGNGIYDVEVPDSGIAIVPPSAEGAALIVIYCSPSSPMTDIVVYEGAETQITGSTLQTVDGFDAAATVAFAEATFIVSDGQGVRPILLSGRAIINGVDLTAVDFDGDEGASCTAPAGLYFDVDTGDASTAVLPGDTSLDATVEAVGDCLSWSALVFAVSTDTVDNPAAGCLGAPPVCDTGGPYVAECKGDSTTVQLDGSGSFDPEGDPIQFLWTTTCPGAGFDDPTIESPTLEIDSPPPCPVACEVTLTVSDPTGLSSTCTSAVTVADTTPPNVTALLMPVPERPERPRSDPRQCKGPSTRTFRVVCGAEDSCAPSTTIDAAIRVAWHEVGDDLTCQEQFEDVPVACGEEITLKLQRRPCSPKPRHKPHRTVTTTGAGTTVLHGEQFVLRVRGTDTCGNDAFAEWNPAIEPSPLCTPEPDRVCCPAITKPQPERCPNAPCS